MTKYKMAARSTSLQGKGFRLLRCLVGNLRSRFHCFHPQTGTVAHQPTQKRLLSTSSSLSKYYLKPNYLKKWGRRDMKRRALFQEKEQERCNLRLIRKSDILPSAVRKKAAEDLSQLPLNSSITRVRNRCVLTDRARGIVGRYRVSRMMFRYFAEKGSMAGMQKSQW